MAVSVTGSTAKLGGPVVMPGIKLRVKIPA